MNDSQFDSVLDEMIEARPRDISPPRDLWPGIESAIEMRTAARRKTVLPIYSIASVVCLVLVGSWFVLTPGAEDISDSASFSVDMAAIVQDMDKGFEVKKASLLESYHGEIAHTSNWRDQISELESARQAIKESLKRDPDNLHLIRILQNIHHQQLGLIESVHQKVAHSI